jgi:hypothetical protein
MKTLRVPSLRRVLAAAAALGLLALSGCVAYPYGGYGPYDGGGYYGGYYGAPYAYGYGGPTVVIGGGWCCGGGWHGGGHWWH